MVYIPGEPPAGQEQPAPVSRPYPNQPPPQQYIPPAAPKKSRTGLVIGLFVGGVVIVLGVGVGVGVGLILGRGSGSTGKPAANPSPTCDVIGINGCTTKAGNGGGPVQYSPPAAQAIPVNVKQACDLNEEMRTKATDGDLRGQGAAIGQIQSLAGNASIFDVRFAANMLKDRYDLAVAARGGADEASTTIELLTASIKMSTACVQSGWSKA